MNVIIVVGGSVLVFFFFVIEVMSDGGVRVGLLRVLLMDLVIQIVFGVVWLVQEIGKYLVQVYYSIYVLLIQFEVNMVGY